MHFFPYFCKRGTYIKMVNGPYLDEFLDFFQVSMLQSHLRDPSFVLQVSDLDYHEKFLTYGQYLVREGIARNPLVL